MSETRKCIGGTLTGHFTNSACKDTYPVNITTSVTLNCTVACINADSNIWGDMTYTHDSNICLAAVHAGAIPSTGGQVFAAAEGTCLTYNVTTKHGITSRSWITPWGHSVYFPSVSNGACNQ